MRFFQHTRKTKRKKKRKTKAKGKQIRSVMRTTIKKKPRKITSSIQPKHCDHLSKLYTKWENLHNTIFNHVETLSPKEIEDLQKKAADTIIKKDLDITNIKILNDFFLEHKPQAVINCAAFVGGISYGYKFPAKMLSENTKMALNLYQVSNENKVSILINLYNTGKYDDVVQKGKVLIKKFPDLKIEDQFREKIF